MPEFRVGFKSSAEKEFLQLPNSVLERIFAKIESLALDPRPPGAKKLKGGRDLWRIRIGDYRAVYSIDDAARTVEVTRVAHRREVYG